MSDLVTFSSHNPRPSAEVPHPVGDDAQGADPAADRQRRLLR
jgi:hypothetical protein